MRTKAEVDHIVGQTLNRHARMLDELVEAAGLAGVTPGRHLVHQKAAPAIVDFVESRDVGRSGVPGSLIGNTAEHVLDEITCSVLALKPAGFVSPVTAEQ